MFCLPAHCFRETWSSGKIALFRRFYQIQDRVTNIHGAKPDDEKNSLQSFLTKWDSTSYKQEDKTRIIDIISQLYGRFMRPVPNFINFIVTLNKFVDWKTEPGFLSNWLTGLSEIVFDPRYPTENIDRYIRNTGLMITDNVISEVSGMRWKVKNTKLTFLHDTVFKAIINDATLTCYSQKDSTEIYNVSGVYYPEFQQFHGTKGIVTWEKAGFPRDEVFAELSRFSINTSKNNFSVDSALLTHKLISSTCNGLAHRPHHPVTQVLAHIHVLRLTPRNFIWIIFMKALTIKEGLPLKELM